MPHQIPRSQELLASTRALVNHTHRIAIPLINSIETRIQTLPSSTLTKHELKRLSWNDPLQNSIAFKNQCLLGASGYQVLADILSINHTLESMTIENEFSLTDNSLSLVTNALKLNHTLTQLNLVTLSSFGIGNNVALPIYDLLTVSQTLQSLTLKLRNCNINCAQLLSTSLTVNKSLKSFKIISYDIRDDSMALFAEALKSNSTLTSFSISGHFISRIGLAALTAALLENRSLRYLDISENNILDIASISTLKQLLNINHRLISLKFDDITVPSTHNLNLTTIQQCMDGLNDIKATISTNIIRSTREYIDVFTFIKRCRLLKLHKDRDQFNPAREILSYNLPLSEDDIALIYRLIETDSLGKLHNCASASNQERRKFFLTQQLKWFVPEECESKLAQIMSTIYQMN